MLAVLSGWRRLEALTLSFTPCLLFFRADSIFDPPDLPIPPPPPPVPGIETLYPSCEEGDFTEDELVILRCALKANMDQGDWGQLLTELGIKEVKNIRELREEDFHKPKFLPLMSRRIANFQQKLAEVSSGSSSRVPSSAAEAVPSPASPVPPPALPDFTLTLCSWHRPPPRRRNRPEYWLFWAAGKNCKECVRKLVCDHKVDVNVRSDTEKYTVKSFAVAWLPACGADDMCAFLDRLHP